MLRHIPARLACQICTARCLVFAPAREYRLGRDLHGNRASTSAETLSKDQSPSFGEHLGPKQISNIINAYRRYGYLDADLDPLGLWERRPVAELDAQLYGFDAEALNTHFNNGTATGAEFIEHLRKLYCGTIAVEFMHLTDVTERKWFAEKFERFFDEDFESEERIAALKIMLYGKAWENFLAKKFPTLKRYSCEGSEVALALHQYLLEESVNYGIKEFIFDGAHRGRLALQTTVFQFPAAQIFRKIRGKIEFPADVSGSGDVLTHQPWHFDYKPRVEMNSEKRVHVSTIPNPSHLEVSLAVALGKCRARAQTLRVGDYATNGAVSSRVGDAILSVHHHGDGAFTGQGVVWESLLISSIPHFRIGGSIHVVVNNQIAFTAERFNGRSTAYCTDIAKAIDAPVIHVNGDHVEKVLLAGKLALAYRHKFRKEIFIDLVCYRKYGHNELDDPSFTQPLMYRKIGERYQHNEDHLKQGSNDNNGADGAESVVDRFIAQLDKSGEFSAQKSKEYYQAQWAKLDADLASVDADRVEPICDHLRGNWTGFIQAPAAVERWDTGLSLDLLQFIGIKSVEVPDGFNIHSHLKRTHVEARLKRLTNSTATIDWSTAEAMAMGSLLLQGFDVRISGQDVGRATFSHRHAMLVDQITDLVYVPLNHIADNQLGHMEIANSPLSEAAIVAFEYGFAMENPRRLVLWEAQFGDFYNGAQVQIDTLLASGESKWLRQNGLVLVLPHGFDGAGPDHSSAHVERFLQLTDSAEGPSVAFGNKSSRADGEDVNFHVVQPTTSAQYFHLLRRQMIVPYRKPLIIIGPKILLRHPSATVSLKEFGPGTYFKPVLCSYFGDSSKVEKLIFTSGKHAVTLQAEIDKRALHNTIALVRLERLCPFPVDELAEVLKRFNSVKEFVWSQEEPMNAGCWNFIAPRFRNWLGVELRYTGRPPLAWMATAIGETHTGEARRILENVFA